MKRAKHNLASSKVNPHLNLYSNLLLTLGLLSLLLLSILLYQRYNPQTLAFTNSEIVASEEKNYSLTQPIGVQINTLDLSLPIVPAEVKDNKWESTTKGVSYLKSSAIPGEEGNSILYAHNWPNLFGNLKKINTGDKVTIIYSDNSRRDFEVEYLVKVAPTETSILKKSEDKRITLYTCTGFLDSERLVVVAKLLDS